MHFLCLDPAVVVCIFVARILPLLCEGWYFSIYHEGLDFASHWQLVKRLVAPCVAECFSLCCMLNEYKVLAYILFVCILMKHACTVRITVWSNCGYKDCVSGVIKLFFVFS